MASGAGSVFVRASRTGEGRGDGVEGPASTPTPSIARRGAGGFLATPM